MDIYALAKFYENPSLPFQDIEKQKRRGQTDEKTVYPTPTPPPQCGGGGEEVVINTSEIDIEDHTLHQLKKYL